MLIANQLYVNFLENIEGNTNMLPGESIKIIQGLLNASILETTLDMIGGKVEENPVLRNRVKEVLTSGTRALTQDDILRGTPNNGAYRIPDWDDVDYPSTNADYPGDKYGAIAPVPEEALFVTSRSCDLIKNQTVRPQVDVKKISTEYYTMNINNPLTRPNKDLVWAITGRAYTSAGSNASDWENPLANTEYDVTTAEIKGVPLSSGEDNAVSETFASGVEHIIFPKGWLPVKYQLFYYKKPSKIIVDIKQPENSVNSELPDELENLVIATAIRRYNAILASDNPQGYQVRANEEKQ